MQNTSYNVQQWLPSLLKLLRGQLYTLPFHSFYILSLLRYLWKFTQKSNNMLTPSEQRSLAFQKELAAGRFSALQAPTDDDTDRVSSYFDRDMTTTTRKFILGTSSSILFLENRVFKVISTPSMTIGRDSRQTITGHFGDKLLHPNPISISGDAATLDVLVVAKKSIDGTSVLDALMATTYSVTATIVSEDPDTTPITFPFPQMGADEDPMVTFENY